MSEEKKILLHSVEAEQSILGSILLDKDVISLASKRLNIDTFYNNAHKIIYQSMLNLYENKTEIDLVTLVEELRNQGYLDAIGGIAYISSLSTIVPTTNNINYYIDIVLDKYIRREAIENLKNIYNSLYNSKIEDIKGDIENLRNILINNKSIEKMYLDISEIKRNKSFEEAISTGFNELDDMLGGGFKITSLVILTGEPGSGKSTIINQIIAGAIQDGYKTFLYSGELPTSDLVFWFDRTVANEYHLEEKISKKNKKYVDVSNTGWDLIGKWGKEKLKIYGDDSDATKDNILSVIENLAINRDFKFFVLDNLMTFNIGNSEDQYNQQKQLCLALKHLAKKYGLVIILVAHPKKPSKGERPSMYDVSGASEIVGSADTVIRTVRPEAQNEDETSKILLLKNRWGSTVGTKVTMYFDKFRKRFYTEEGSELERNYGYDANEKLIPLDDKEMPF